MECELNDTNAPASIPFTFDDYCQLIDWTGRAIRNDKRGYIPNHIQSLLKQLGIKPEYWLDTVQHFGSRFPRMMGRVDRLKKTVERFEQHWCRGVWYGKKVLYIMLTRKVFWMFA